MNENTYIEDYKGRPVLSLLISQYTDNEGNLKEDRLKLGIRKCKAILHYLKDIKEFVEGYGAGHG